VIFVKMGVFEATFKYMTNSAIIGAILLVDIAIIMAIWV